MEENGQHFDAYFTWLGIPPDEQPPNRYRLLGLPLYTDAPAVIENAVDQRMAHLRTFQAGKHAADCQRLLNVLADARVTLLNAEKRAAYDAQLRTQFGASAASPTPSGQATSEPAWPAVFKVDADVSPVRARVAARRSRPNPAVLGLAAAAAVAALGVALWWAVAGERSRVQAKPQPAPMAAPARPTPAPGAGKSAERHGTPPRLEPKLPGAVEPLPADAPFDEETARLHQARWAKYFGVPEELTNSIGMRFVLIPPGEFLMGSIYQEVEQFLHEAEQHGAPEWYVERVPDETPKHRVRITRPFYLGMHEVTQAQYEVVMNDNPSRFEDDPSRPVESVDWHEAVEFCRRLGALSNEQAAAAAYRLPTEAEWEYACRAGTSARYSFGDDETLLEQHAWGPKNSDAQTHPVGRLRPNPFGLFDIHGNVFEWCADWHTVDYYTVCLEEDPPGPELATWRVLRGGSALSGTPGACRSAFRTGAPPHTRDTRLQGLRVVRTLTP